MTAQLILLGTRRPGTDDEYQSYVSAAGPLLAAAGAAWNGQFDHVEDLAGEGPAQVRIMDFPDAASIRDVFNSPEYQEIIPLRDKAFEDLGIMIATTVP